MTGGPPQRGTIAELPDIYDRYLSYNSLISPNISC